MRINTVRALQQMDLPLQKIKEVLALDDLAKIIEFLTEAEKMADEKMALLVHSKAKIQLAKSGYENNLRSQQRTLGIIVKHFPKRVIMLSDTMESPSLDNLWSYLSHFYDTLDHALKEKFTFEDTAAIYTENGVSRLFAVCIHYEHVEGLKVLPAGNYLCVDSTEENRVDKLNELIQIANDVYHAQPHFTVQQVLVCGILQWDYQIQVYLGDSSALPYEK